MKYKKDKRYSKVKVFIYKLDGDFVYVRDLQNNYLELAMDKTRRIYSNMIGAVRLVDFTVTTGELPPIAIDHSYHETKKVRWLKYT